MRAVAFALACILAASLTLSVIPPASAAAVANLTLYYDPDCTTPFGEPSQLPFPSSSACQQLPGLGGSFHFQCADDANASSTHFAYQQYGDSNCSGVPVEDVDVDGPTGQCSPATVTFAGVDVSGSAVVFCPAANSSHTATQPSAAALTEATTREHSESREQPSLDREEQGGGTVSLSRAGRYSDIVRPRSRRVH